VSVQVFASNANYDTGPIITGYWSTTTQTSVDQANFNGRGAIVTLGVTGLPSVVTGMPAGQIQLIVQGHDIVSGYYTIFTSPPVDASKSSVNSYLIHVDAPVSPTSAKSPLPRTWNVIVKALNASPASYVVGASIIL
jgi:hypothetical protein